MTYYGLGDAAEAMHVDPNGQTAFTPGTFLYFRLFRSKRNTGDEDTIRRHCWARIVKGGDDDEYLIQRKSMGCERSTPSIRIIFKIDEIKLQSSISEGSISEVIEKLS